MKKKSIILIGLSILYLCVSFLYSRNVFDTDGRYNEELSRENSLENYIDRTVEFNKQFYQTMSRLEQENRSEENKNAFVNFYARFMSYDGVDTYFYFSSVDEVNDMIKKYNLKNVDNFDFSKNNHPIPFEDKRYKNTFSNFTKEKQEAKIIGKDKNGRNMYDVSPDTILLAVYKGDIKYYAYIDNRLVDTRDLLKEKEQFFYYSGELAMKLNDDSNYKYNRYKFFLDRRKVDTKDNEEND